MLSAICERTPFNTFVTIKIDAIVLADDSESKWGSKSQICTCTTPVQNSTNEFIFMPVVDVYRVVFLYLFASINESQFVHPVRM